MPLLDPVSSALFLVGLAVVLYEWRRIESALLLAWLLIALVFGGVLLVNPPEVQRFVTLAPLLCLLIAVGIDLGARFLTNAVPQVRRFVPALAALCVAGLGVWSLHFYFAVYTPRNDLGFRTTESTTAIGRYLAARPGRYVYFVGPPFTYLGNGSIEFIGRARGFDVPQPIGARGLPPPPRGLRPLVVFDPARMSELGAVRRRYPGTTVKSYHSDVDGAPLFAAYTPSRSNWP
jgi:hypothetical protein